MARTASMVTARAQNLLSGDSGMPFALAQIAQESGTAAPAFDPSQVVAQNVAADTAERAGQARYPMMYLYCERVQNTLREKFRTFSGSARLVIETRLSQDRLEGLGQQVQTFSDAVTSVLDNHRGDWGNGMFFAGAYEINYGPIKHGGKNFLQTVKVVLDVEISKS